MKKTMTSKEFIEKIQEDPTTVDATKWFSFDRQDQMMFNVALELYIDKEYNTQDQFWSCLDEAKGLLRVFYNHRYNPHTRTGR